MHDHPDELVDIHKKLDEINERLKYIGALSKADQDMNSEAYDEYSRKTRDYCQENGLLFMNLPQDQWPDSSL